MKTAHKGTTQVSKLETGIPGLDLIGKGGVPRERTTLVSGTAGSAKTILAAQFLVQGIARDENGVFVTFEESPDDIRKNILSFGWDIQRWEKEDKWAFVDGSRCSTDDVVEAGGYDLGALLARIGYAVGKVHARRVVMDSLGAIFSRFSDSATLRNELFRIGAALKQMKVTALMTAERTEEYGKISRFGVGEFVADNVIILRNVLQEEKRRRTLEILKFRGTTHQKGEFPFTITPHQGITIIPLSAIELKQKSSNVRVSSGNRQLDVMCEGGFFRDSIVLVSGATGCGKTLMVTEFVGRGTGEDERSLLFAFEESRQELCRNALGWGVDFDKMEKEGRLKVVCSYPESTGLENHLLRINTAIEEFQPHRLAVDSLSALESVSTIKNFREFVISLTSFVKQREMVALLTFTTPILMGGVSTTEAHISTITDSIILLRYVEMYGEILRGITILKMRGSAHNKKIRKFSIDGEGMHIGEPFQNVVGILAGNPTQITPGELARFEDFFPGG